MRITRQEYQEYLRRKRGKQPNNLTIFTGRDDIQIKENMSINLTSNRELINITISDDLIHIYYVNSGEW